MKSILLPDARISGGIKQICQKIYRDVSDADSENASLHQAGDRCSTMPARIASHMVFFPAVAVMLAVLSFNFIGDALRDYLDPRSRIEAGL